MPKVFILGSCVSRDTTPFLGEGWTIAQYVARQGLVSATSGPADLRGEPKLASAFQNRCLQQDITGSAFEMLRERKEETDLVLLDLIDERLGIYKAQNGSYITHSWELDESGLLDEQPENLEYVAFGSDKHYDLWSKAAEILVDRVQSLNIPLVVLAPEWAAKADNGGGGFDYRNIPASKWNDLYDRYYNHFEKLGVEVIRPPAKYSVASMKHQWGLAPYHFVDHMYEYMQQRIKHYYFAASSIASS